MKYEITDEDKKIMERDMATDRTLKHLRNMSFYKFSIGDVLIREEKTWREPSVWRTTTASCGLPNKFVYVFENELGVGYIRRLSVNGRKFVDHPVCITQFDPDQTRFSLDPEYADHMLLASDDDKFDTTSRYDTLKKKRERFNRKNLKLKVPMDTVGDTEAWIRKLKVGDKFWWGYSLGTINKLPYEVTKEATPTSSWDGPNWTFDAIEIGGGATRSVTFWASNVKHYYMFETRPYFIDEVLD